MMEVGFGLKGAICTSPQNTNILSLMVSLKPSTTATAIIMTATLSAVATVAKRIMNREKDALRLEAMRRAIKKGKFNLLSTFTKYRYQIGQDKSKVSH